MLTRETVQESLETGNHLMGTVPYTAPEQLEGHAATTASDVYAFGLVMYEMVTGRQPFSGQTPLSAIYKRLQSAPPAPHTLAPGVDRICHHALPGKGAECQIRRRQSDRKGVSAGLGPRRDSRMAHSAAALGRGGLGTVGTFVYAISQ
jgi:serine/threonine-protein kinase